MKLVDERKAQRLLQGVGIWRADLRKVISLEKRTYEISHTEKRAVRNFEDLHELERKFDDILESKGFKLSEGAPRHNSWGS